MKLWMLLQLVQVIHLEMESQKNLRYVHSPFKVFKLDVKDLSLVKEFDFKKDAFGFPTVAYPVDEYIYLGSFTMDRIVRFKQ